MTYKHREQDRKEFLTPYFKKMSNRILAVVSAVATSVLVGQEVICAAGVSPCLPWPGVMSHQRHAGKTQMRPLLNKG
ncbi:hypothetical protein DKP78_14860 [Enterococcus faecium]|nr:hypothetical protein DKP78_14860 [Enterococcus faecium]